MTMAARWRRIDAEHWTHRLLQTHTAVLALWSAWALFLSWMGGVLLFALVPAALTALSGWLTSAWRRELRWGWWAVTILSGMRCLTLLTALLDGYVRWGGLAVLAFDAVLLALLAHPDSRERMEPPATPVPHEQSSSVR